MASWREILPVPRVLYEYTYTRKNKVSFTPENAPDRVPIKDETMVQISIQQRENAAARDTYMHPCKIYYIGFCMHPIR